MIFAIVGIIILLYSTKNFKKGFMIYLTYKLLLVTNISLVSIPGIPLLTVEMFMTLVYIFLFFSQGKKYEYAHMKFPFRVVFLCLFACWFLSAIFAIAGFKSELSNLIKITSEDIMLIWMMWEILEEKTDFFMLYKYITVVMFISCVYGIIEYVIQSNPLTMYEATLIHDESKSFLGIYTNMDRGYRIKSIYEHAIGAGINWGMYSVFSIWIWINSATEDRKKLPKLSMVTALLCIPCIILTKMRSPLVFFAIATLSLINFKRKRFYNAIIVGMIMVIVLIPLISQNYDIFISFFDSSAQKTIGGSTVDTRFIQFTSAFEVIKKSPIIGLGNKFASVLPKSQYALLYGMESIWLWVIVQYGLVGVIIYVLYLIYSVVIIPKKFSCRQIMFFFLAYWITYTASSIPGAKMYLLYLIVFYFIKTSEKYKRNKTEGNVYGVYMKNGSVICGKIKKKATGEDNE